MSHGGWFWPPNGTGNQRQTEEGQRAGDKTHRPRRTKNDIQITKDSNEGIAAGGTQSSQHDSDGV